jgi:hypothetical protein
MYGCGGGGAKTKLRIFLILSECIYSKQLQTLQIWYTSTYEYSVFIDSFLQKFISKQIVFIVFLLKDQSLQHLR